MKRGKKKNPYIHLDLQVNRNLIQISACFTSPRYFCTFFFPQGGENFLNLFQYLISSHYRFHKQTLEEGKGKEPLKASKPSKCL